MKTLGDFDPIQSIDEDIRVERWRFTLATVTRNQASDYDHARRKYCTKLVLTSYSIRVMSA